MALLKGILERGLVLLVFAAAVLFTPGLAWGQEPEWRIVVETPEAAFSREELKGLLDDAYFWLSERGMVPAPPCGDGGYLVLVSGEVGLLEGWTYTQTYYRPGTLEVARACVEWFKMGLYNDPEGGFTRGELGDIYVSEAKMTIVHELFHAVQAGWEKYVYLDDSVEKAAGWISESSATAIEYFYVGFLDAFVVTSKGSYTTLESRLAESIKDYFSAALWMRDPFKVSLESYDEHYERLYDYSPLFIWLFREKGVGQVRAFFESPDPREDPVVRELIAEFLHHLPQGFVYNTINKTVVMYPRAHLLETPDATVTIDTNSAVYLSPQIPAGRYTIELSNPNVEVSVTYRNKGLTIVDPSEIVVREDTIIALVNRGDKPSIVRLTLVKTGDYTEGEPLATTTITVTQTHTQTTVETRTLTLTLTETLFETVRETLTQVETYTLTTTQTITHTQTLEKVRTVTLEKPVTLTIQKTITQTLEPPTVTQTVTTEKTVTTTLVTTLQTEAPREAGGFENTLPYLFLGLMAGLAIALLYKRG